MGIFVVVLAGLGVTYSQQVKEKKQVEEKLELTELRLDMFDIAELESNKKNLEISILNLTSQYDSYRADLTQSVISSDVVDKCYEIAEDSNVKIVNIGSSAIKVIELAAVECLAINLNINVTGTLEDYITFITNLNNSYTTGYVSAIQILLEDESNATVQLVVYSYEGE